MNQEQLEQWLIDKELHYRGEDWKPQNVQRFITSPADPRRETGFPSHGMTGGDRMQDHGYAAIYAKHIHNLLHRPLTVAEVGILQGTGLAVWCDLPNVRRVCGFDVDLSHFINNHDLLKNRGAFVNKQPTIYRFDQYVINPTAIRNNFHDQEIDIYIDDATHDPWAAVASLIEFMPFIKKGGLIFIEDIPGFSDILGSVSARLGADYLHNLSILESTDITVARVN